MTSWDGDAYQARFDALAATGAEMHGEVDFVEAYDPGDILDAGCGTGRVSIELNVRGHRVTGVDVDRSMLATARVRAPEITWIEADLTEFDLGRRFELVLMAGNVPLFTPTGTEGALVSHVAAHVDSGGLLVAGFSLDRGYTVANYDAHCTAAGLELVERFSTWARGAWDDGEYAVSVHRRS